MMKFGILGLVAIVGAGMAAPVNAAGLYGTLSNGNLPNGRPSYTFAAVSTYNGAVTTMFDFTLNPGSNISGMAFDPGSGLFVAVTNNGNIAKINASTWVVTEAAINTGLLPVSPYTNFQGIEYDPTQALGQRVLVTYGQSATLSIQNQIAALDTNDVVTANTGILTISDGDALVFNPLGGGQLIVADTNDPPFKAISNIFGPPLPGDYSIYASPSPSNEYFDPACAPDGTIYFSRRDDQKLYKLSGNAYVAVGPHNTAVGIWAQTLAYGEVPAPATVSIALLTAPVVLRRRRTAR